MTTLKKKLVKIDAKVVTHAYFAFQMARVAILRGLFADSLRSDPRNAPAAFGVNDVRCSRVMSSSQTTGEAPPNDSQFCEFPGQWAG